MVILFIHIFIIELVVDLFHAISDERGDFLDVRDKIVDWGSGRWSSEQGRDLVGGFLDFPRETLVFESPGGDEPRDSISHLLFFFVCLVKDDSVFPEFLALVKVDQELC